LQGKADLRWMNAKFETDTLVSKAALEAHTNGSCPVQGIV
jgi:hypothetical protein